MKPTWNPSDRLGGLRRFATAITVFNVLGHTVFGFEQSFAQPLVALGTGYGLSLLLEWIDARVNRRTPRFASSGTMGFIDFILSAHITCLAVAMLLYANDRLMPIAFAAAVAIGSKSMLQVSVGGRARHFLNPSNFGITITLLLFPWVGIAPPYHFTENLGPIGDWILPAFIIFSGSFLNWRYTKRLPLLIAWVVAFFTQAAIRSIMLETPFEAALMPMSGVAFILFTFYMITDPPTTPSGLKGQIIFGTAVAGGYGLLMANHIVFGLFFSLSAVTAIRGLWLVVQPKLAERRTQTVAAGGGGALAEVLTPSDVGPRPTTILRGDDA
jgi:hypothetical protein